MKKNIVNKSKKRILNRFFLNLEFPDLDEYKNENNNKKIKLRFVDINKIKYLEKLSNRVKGYLTQLNIQFKKLNEKDLIIKSLLDEIKTKENIRKKSVGKIGGLTASLNKEREKNKILLENTSSLNNTILEISEQIKNKNLEIEAKNMEIKILKNLGKKKNIDDYKKLNELKKDIEKNKKR